MQTSENYGYFEADKRFGQPQDPRTIDFAKDILIDLAKRYKFPELGKAVVEDAFLQWNRPSGRTLWPGHGNKIPPFLVKNVDPHSRFFVTGPGTLRVPPLGVEGEVRPRARRPAEQELSRPERLSE